jgi:CHAT domain-containing protein
LAESYHEQKRLDSARYWLALSESFHLTTDPELSNTLLLKASWLSESKDFEAAEAAFTQAFSSISEKFGEQSAPYAIALRKRAESRLAQGDRPNGLKDLQKSIKDLEAAQALAEWVISEQVYCKYLADGVLKTSMENDIQQLKEHSGKALEVIGGLRQSYASDADRQSLLGRGYRLYELALLAHALEEEKPDYAAIFSFMEKSKNSLLYENWLRGKAEDQGSNPELLAAEKDLRRQILYLEEKISAEAGDQGKLQNRLFLLRQKHQQLRDSLSNSDPWFRMANDWQPVSLQSVQAKLKVDDAMLSYFVGDSMVFMLLIQHDDCQLFQGKTPADLIAKIEQMRRGIFQPYLPDFVKQSISYSLEDYQLASQELYQHLLAPMASSLPTHLIILPDGPMADLPFAALLTDASSDSYLVQQHSISYAWSASLWTEMRQRNESLDPPSKKIFAMAPAFSGTGEEMDIRSYHRGFLGPLPFSGKEVSAIARIFETDSLLGKKASSEAFWEKAEDYRIIHLSTHGKANREDPDHSFLAFASDKPGQESGSERSGDQASSEELLYLSQLSLLRLQAEMVVLSACETGTGTTFRGEGIYSLARGFTSAGAGSLVSTLWQVNDQLTASLMQRFYEGLAEGKAKDVALREAQLALIAEGESPFYWAGFTVIGDERPLRKHGFNYYWLLLLLVPAAYLLYRKIS